MFSHTVTVQLEYINHHYYYYYYAGIMLNVFSDHDLRIMLKTMLAYVIGWFLARVFTTVSNNR